MKDNRFTKKVLLVIAFLLAMNIVLTILYNSPDSHAAKGAEYKVVKCYYEAELLIPGLLDFLDLTAEEYDNLLPEIKMEKIINAYVKEGWEFVEYAEALLLIFKR